MKKFSRRIFSAILIGSSLGLTFLPALSHAQSPSVVVFAAASMKTALDAIAAKWQAESGKKSVISYASSAVLAKQIEQGGPSDIFISADQVWMDYLEKAKLIVPGTRRNLVANELVLIEPADQKTSLTIAPGFDLAGAAGSGKIAVCTINSCPGGIYAKQSFTNLGIWPSVEPKLAQADNIRNALLLVARGEARFGVVYATDAKAEPNVRVTGIFPGSSHEPIVYPAALVAASGGAPINPDAESFFTFLFKPGAGAILEGQGFTLVK